MCRGSSQVVIFNFKEFVLIQLFCALFLVYTATRIQLNFHSNLLCTYASRLKQIS